ncbi:MAG: protein-disulfide isomerase [Mycobacterium sp.]|nr:protein-disulfide isomerase [Mycobacterium sp.]
MASASGQLVVTYRPMTFLDEKSDGYSARVSKALFVAAGPETSSAAFQEFVEMARDSGVPLEVVGRDSARDSAVDTEEMGLANFDSLMDVNPFNPGTPTVYDITQKDVVEIQRPDWLDQLVEAA